MQTRGYNAFSYADISAEVGIRKASIHYYFPSKGDLGRHLVARYRQTFRKKRDQIDHKTDDSRLKLTQYIQLYLDGLQNERLCLCGMLAADFNTLPQAVPEEVKSFFADNEAWLAKVLTEGSKAGVIRCNGLAEVEAQLLLAALQGAMLVARSRGDISQFQAIAQKLLAMLEVKSQTV
ncbi:MAG: TetR/AcrR family transcriptional regulator [Gloeocapsa sp. UFS-A4-WI-NPMV-4B04]|nr:TetR/AcrR family transcriptional regulator [Gloeocapsa sp. UFS-A4-WI-NPMV-4B04]